MNALNVLWIVTLSFLVHCILQVGAYTQNNLGFLTLCSTSMVLGCVVLVFVGGLVWFWFVFFFFESHLRYLVSTQHISTAVVNIPGL